MTITKVNFRKMLTENLSAFLGVMPKQVSYCRLASFCENADEQKLTFRNGNLRNNGEILFTDGSRLSTTGSDRNVEQYQFNEGTILEMYIESMERFLYYFVPKKGETL